MFLLGSCKTSFISKFETNYGMVKISDNLFVDKCEITVNSWITFYDWVLENESKAQAEMLLPDKDLLKREVWEYFSTRTDGNEISKPKIKQTGLPLKNVLIHCPELHEQSGTEEIEAAKSKCVYGDYPITGVSYDQVLQFCEWRTKMLGDTTVVFRLPSEKEWIKIALAGFNKNELNQEFTDSITINGCLLYNYYFSEPCERYIEINLLNPKLCSVGCYSCSQVGLYDIFGNVSEMTMTKGIAKGGNYHLFASQCHQDLFQTYNKPEEWLGFRCVAIKK